MKIKNERGITGIDIVGGLIIFMFASSAILVMYYNLYVNVTSIKIHETAIGIITDIFEKIDLENYDEITETKIAELISDSGANEYFSKEKNNSNISYELEKYTDINSYAKMDLVKKIKITVKYQINGENKEVSLYKIKIKE